MIACIKADAQLEALRAKPHAKPRVKPRTKLHVIACHANTIHFAQFVMV